MRDRTRRRHTAADGTSEQARESNEAAERERGIELTTLEVGRLLRLARHRRGLTLLEVERMSGGVLVCPTIAAYERGDRRPTVPQADEILRWYDAGVSIRIEVEHPITCQISGTLPRWCCGYPSGDGRYGCEHIGSGEHKHCVGEHTQAHERAGNGYSCESVQQSLDEAGGLAAWLRRRG